MLHRLQWQNSACQASRAWCSILFKTMKCLMNQKLLSVCCCTAEIMYNRTAVGISFPSGAPCPTQAGMPSHADQADSLHMPLVTQRPPSTCTSKLVGVAAAKPSNSTSNAFVDASKISVSAAMWCPAFCAMIMQCWAEGHAWQGRVHVRLATMPTPRCTAAAPGWPIHSRLAVSLHGTPLARRKSMCGPSEPHAWTGCCSRSLVHAPDLGWLQTGPFSMLRPRPQSRPGKACLDMAGDEAASASKGDAGTLDLMSQQPRRWMQCWHSCLPYPTGPTTGLRWASATSATMPSGRPTAAGSGPCSTTEQVWPALAGCTSLCLQTARKGSACARDHLRWLSLCGAPGLHAGMQVHGCGRHAGRRPTTRNILGRAWLATRLRYSHNAAA